LLDTISTSFLVVLPTARLKVNLIDDKINEKTAPMIAVKIGIVPTTPNGYISENT